MNQEEKHFCAEKSSESFRMSLTYCPTVEQARAWIGGAESFRITDKRTDEVIEQKNGEMFDRKLETTDTGWSKKKEFF